MSLRTRLMVSTAVLVALALIVTVAGYGWWRREGSRQPRVSAAIPTMDTAIATTLRAAGDAPVTAVTGIFRGTTCKLGLLRTGGRFTRSADLYVPVGEEEALIARITTGLPASFAPRRGAGAGGRAAPLTATAGGGVEVSVRHIGPGWVIARARTGCTGGQQPAVDVVDAASVPGAATIDRLLGALNTGPAETRQHRLQCPGGVTTVAVLSRPTDAANLRRRLRPVVPADATRFRSDSNRVSYREQAASVTVSASDDNTAVTVTFTSAC